MPEPETCATCKYSKNEDYVDPILGPMVTCRLNPPTHLAGWGMGLRVRVNEWCSYYKAVPGAP